MASSSSAPNPVFMRRAIAEARAHLAALAGGAGGRIETTYPEISLTPDRSIC